VQADRLARALGTTLSEMLAEVEWGHTVQRREGVTDHQ